MKTINLQVGIKDFISMLTDSEKDYQWNYEQVNLLDKRTQDLLHSLELDKLTTGEKNKIATQLRQVRKQRRSHKNIVESNQAVVEFLKSDRGKSIYNLLREVQGKTRKIEEYHANRTYKKKVSITN